MKMFTGFLYSIIISFCSNTLQVQGESDLGPAKSLDIVKRYIRWNNNGYIVSSAGSPYEIKYLQPHVRNVAVESDGDYLAFTLYMRNGREEAPNTGIFHFIDSYIADKKRTYCDRKTRHAGAYFHFYGKCPEEEQMIVASGYCYQGSNGRDLVFNSFTFNSASMKYIDGRYYLNNDRTVHNYEQNLIKVCFNNWKDSGFKVNKWNCSTKNVPLASRLTSDFGKRSKRASTACNDCECTPVNESSGKKCFEVEVIFILLCLLQMKMY